VPIIDQEPLLEVALPCVWVAGVQQRAGVRNVCKVEVALLLGNGIWQVARWVDIAIKNINNAVAGLLTTEVGRKDSGNVRVVGKAVKVC